MKRGKPAAADCRDLFEGFPDGAVLESFQKIQLASNDAPTPSFGRKFSERQQLPDPAD